jgi:hypothetical protein
MSGESRSKFRPQNEKPQPLVYFDPKTPKICATCLFAAEAGDKQWICLKRTKVCDPEHGNGPFLVAVHLYANAANCSFWTKGAELVNEPTLSDKELQALRRK